MLGRRRTVINPILHIDNISFLDFKYTREAKMLCKKIINFFSLLSKVQEMESKKLGMTQELLSLVTGLAHYLKILIRVALTAALDLVNLPSIEFVHIYI